MRSAVPSMLAAAAIALGAVTTAIPAWAGPMSTSPEQAYDMGQIPSARAVGMGDALNAQGGSTTALYLNPANMTLARVYHLEAVGAFSPEAQRQTYGLAVVDLGNQHGRPRGGPHGSLGARSIPAGCTARGRTFARRSP